MASALSATDLARMARSGIAALPVDAALALLDASLGAEPAVLVPVRLNDEALRSGSGQVPEMLFAFTGGRARSSRPAGDGRAWREELGAVPADEQETFVLAMVCTQVAAVLGHESADDVDPQAEFGSVGFDSLTGLELIRRLSAMAGKRLPTTLSFDFPSPVDLAAYLTKLLT
jgi:acyl carrier protein